MATLIDKVYSLNIGVQGENIARPIELDMTEWVAAYPDASFYVLFRPYNESEAVPMLSTFEDNILTWTPTLSATAVSGVGYTEVRALDPETGLIRKSRIIPTSVENSVTGADENPPQPYTDWVNRILEAGSDAVKGAAAVAAVSQGEEVAFEIDADGHLNIVYTESGEPQTLDLGPVDAYAIAVVEGYTGTREEWVQAMADAEANGLKAEGYAIGKQNGVAVESGEYFQNNAKYYNEQAQSAKEDAETAQAAAETAQTAAETAKTSAAASAADALEHTQSVIETWLGNNIDPDSGYALDRTLAISTAAAPADMVGDLKSAITQTMMPVGITNPVPESDGNTSYKGVSILKSNNYIEINNGSAAETNVVFKISNGLSYAQSHKQASWAAQSLGLETGKSYRLVLSVISGQFSSVSSIAPHVAVRGSDYSTTVYIELTENGALVGTDTIFSNPFTVTADNARYISVYLPTPGIYSNIRILVNLLDVDNFNALLNESELENRITALSVHAPAYQNSVVGLAGKYPAITKSGTKAIVTIKDPTRAYWNNGYAYDSNTTERTFEVTHDHYLVYNTSTKLFRVESASSNFTEYDIVCLYNTFGAFYGQWACFYYSNVSYDGFIPNYYYTNNYLPNKLDAINTISVGLGKQSCQSIFITDYHKDNNACVSPVLIREIIKNTGLSSVVFGGDAITWDYTSKLAGVKLMCDFMADFRPVEDIANVYYITGNHEQNDANGSNPESRLPQEVAYRFFNEPIYYKINCIDGCNSYFVDDDVSRIRMYYIDCDYTASIPIIAREKICDSLLTVPEGYAVLIYSHRGLTLDNTSVTGVFRRICECCVLMNDGTEGDITLTVSADQVETPIEKHYDFRGKARTFIGAITGHTHIDGYVMFDGRFPVIAVACDAYDSQSSHTERVPGSIYEQAFDVVQIDVSAQRIYLTRIGQGDDRVFSFGEAGSGLITG